MRAFVGVEKCCGAVSAAMVDDDGLSARGLGLFVRDVVRTGRKLDYIEVERGSITIEGCRCSSQQQKGDEHGG